jgi:class 3 adenylate cyclase
MFRKTRNKSILFADISGSTKMYDTLGDEQARNIVSQTLDRLDGVVNRFQGQLIKTIGDEIMCTFDSAEQSTNAAVEMQEVTEEANEAGELPMSVYIKVGYHHGPVIEKLGDVHGDAVNVAARMVQQAKPQEIITTWETIKELPDSLQADTRFLDYAPIKGKGNVEIMEVIWQEENVTQMAADPQAMAPPQEEDVALRLSYQDKQLTVSPERDSVSLGRSPGCDLQVGESLASRQHVLIELRRDKFFLIDQSTNGTYMRPEGGSEAFVRREEVPLTGSGEISLGRSFEDDPQDLVHFAVEAG